MRIREAGKICEHLWYLGRAESGVYLLEGNKCSMIINGGLSCILPEVLHQFDAFGIDEQRIQRAETSAIRQAGIPLPHIY